MRESQGSPGFGELVGVLAGPSGERRCRELISHVDHSRNSRPCDHPFTRLADRLLASPRYGERRHWLDVVSLCQNLVYKNAYWYRDYVINAGVGGSQ